jgi:hypothetical protein
VFIEQLLSNKRSCGSPAVSINTKYSFVTFTSVWLDVAIELVKDIETWQSVSNVCVRLLNGGMLLGHINGSG